MELFPFSYGEFLRFKHLQSGADSLQSYLYSGGMPEYLHSSNPFVLGNLLDDILVRDIAVRHAVHDVASLKQLATYLLGGFKKSERRGSNSRPSAWEADALPTELLSLLVVA